MVTYTYRVIENRTWTAYNTAQCEEKSRFVALLSDLCNTVPQPVQEGRGRPRLPLSDMVFASVYKVFVGFSSRRFTCDLRDAFVNGHINTTPHFNSVNRYLSDPQLTDVLKELITASSLPMKAVEADFAVDSSGFSTSRFVRWFNKKHGREVDNREWVKVHLMCDWSVLAALWWPILSVHLLPRRSYQSTDSLQTILGTCNARSLLIRSSASTFARSSL